MTQTDVSCTSTGRPLDHDDFGLNQSKIVDVIDSNNLARHAQISVRNLRKLDCAGKAGPSFPHPAVDAGVCRRQGAIDWRWAIAVIIVAVVQQSIGHLNGDDSWFITFAEKYLDGLTPYVDVSDPNPPAAFLAYVPAIYFARIFAVRPEFAIVLFTFLGAGLAILISGMVLRAAGLLSSAQVPGALAVALYLCLVAPAFCFAEREHFAFLALLPIAAILAARIADRHVALSAALLAGIGAGLATTFKPYFLLPLALAFAGTVLVRPKCAARLVPEIAAVAMVLATYSAAVLLVFPAYLGTLSLALDVYAPVHDRISNLLTSPLFVCNVALLGALAYVARRGLVDLRARVCALFSIGFLATFVIQGKGWTNHTFPGLAFALFALAAQLRFFSAPALRAAQRQRSFTMYVFLPVLCAAPFLFGAVQLVTNGEEHPGLTAAVARIAPPRPRIAALAEQLDYGHPLVRRLGGTWVGRQNCLWISWGVKYLRGGGRGDPAAEARRSKYLGADLEMFAEDVRKGKPDVLLVESEELAAWARAQPALSSLFDAYALAGSAGDIEIWRSRSQSGKALQRDPIAAF